MRKSLKIVGTFIYNIDAHFLFFFGLLFRRSILLTRRKGICFANNKGGAGKTFMAYQLACEAARAKAAAQAAAEAGTAAPAPAPASG